MFITWSHKAKAAKELMRIASTTIQNQRPILHGGIIGHIQKKPISEPMVTAV